MKNQKSKLKIKNLFLVNLLLILVLSPDLVWAICQGPLVPCGGVENPCQLCHIFVLINNILNFILTCLTPIIASLMLVIGGFYFLTAGLKPEQVSQAKSIITAAIIGLIVIFIAWVFLNTLLDMIGVAQWTGLRTWWQVECP